MNPGHGEKLQKKTSPDLKGHFKGKLGGGTIKKTRGAKEGQPSERVRNFDGQASSEGSLKETEERPKLGGPNRVMAHRYDREGLCPRYRMPRNLQPEKFAKSEGTKKKNWKSRCSSEKGAGTFQGH